MSKLEELIQELCPNGVEYKTLRDCVQKTSNIKWKTTEGSYLYIDLTSVDRATHKIIETQMVNATDAPSRAQQIVLKGDVLFATTRPTLKRFCLIDDKYDGQVCSTGFCVLRAKENLVIPQWLFHIVSSSEFYYYVEAKQKGASYPAISDKEVKQFEIPVPPLPVQCEIVRILDNFTELTAELQEKLTAELTARKKQYEYYLDQFYGGTYEEMLLLEKRTGWKILPLSGIGTFTRGKRFVKADSEGLEDGVPCIHYGELYTYYGVSAEKSKSFVPVELAQKLRYAHKGDVVIVGAGENNIDIGVGVAWFGEDVVVHDACYIFKHKLNPKYLSYFLRTTIYHNQIKKYVSEGKICSISAQGLGKAIIPVPPMEEQKRIVSILDRFDTFCNNLTSGLPAEIEARQKQYEYYRDKLLDFPEYTKQR